MKRYELAHDEHQNASWMAECATGGWVAYDDALTLLAAALERPARMDCEISLHGTQPDCTEQYGAGKRETHWCAPCLARQALAAAMKETPDAD